MGVSGPLIRVLTGADVILAPGLGSPIRGTLPRALFVALLLDAGQEISRDQLAALFWPDIEQSSARQRLRMTLLNLRRSLGDTLRDRLATTPQGLRLDLAPQETDLGRFNQAIAVDGPGDHERAAELYEGALLGGFPPVSDPFDARLAARREACADQALSAILKTMETRAARGDRAGFVLLHRKALAIDPTDGDVCALAMRFHAERGRPDRVLATFEQYEEALRDAYGVTATDAQRALCDRCLQRAGTVASPAQGPPSPPTARAAHPTIVTLARTARQRSLRLAALATACGAALLAWQLWPEGRPGDRVEVELRETRYNPAGCRVAGLEHRLQSALIGALRQREGVGIVLVPTGLPRDERAPLSVILQTDLICTTGEARAVLTLLDGRDSAVLWSRTYDMLADGLEQLGLDLPAAIEGLR